MEEPLMTDWWLKDPVDFEHKKWLFLAYLKRLDEAFYALDFSPWLLRSESLYNEMDKSYQAILRFNGSLTRNVLIMNENNFHFEKRRPKEEALETLTGILEYSIPLLENKIDFGRKMWSENPKILWA